MRGACSLSRRREQAPRSYLGGPTGPNWKRPCAVQGSERARQATTDVRNQEWPLSFVAQVDFADLQAVCALDGFPATGRLLFFCDPFDWPWGEAEDQARARVIFTQQPLERLERKPV